MFRKKKKDVTVFSSAFFPVFSGITEQLSRKKQNMLSYQHN